MHFGRRNQNFKYYMNGVQLDILRKFAEDTKGGKKVLSQKDADDFQDSLNSLIKWNNFLK